MSSIIIHNLPITLKKYLQKIAELKGLTLSEFLLEDIKTKTLGLDPGF